MTIDTSPEPRLGLRSGLNSEFAEGLKAMESGFHVRSIGTFGADLVCAPVNELAASWLANNRPDFDQFPARRGDATVGVLLRRSDYGSKTVGEAMRPLGEGLIVSADMPIADLIPELRETDHRLVLRGGCIDGLVTRSDLLKLPVRLVVFALITHLEQIMADLISKHWPNDEWMNVLSAGRRASVLKKESELRRRGMNPPRVELTEFGDKRDLCRRLVSGSKRQFLTDLDGLEMLRNQVAHASTFVDLSSGRAGVTAFVDKFESAERWIVELSSLTATKRATT